MIFDLNEDVFNGPTRRILTLSGVSQAPEMLTLCSVLTNNLLNTPPNERVSAEEKTKRYLILQKILNGSENGGRVDLSIDDLSVVSKLVDENCATIVHGRVKEMLNNPIRENRPVPSVQEK